MTGTGAIHETQIHPVDALAVRLVVILGLVRYLAVTLGAEHHAWIGMARTLRAVRTFVTVKPSGVSTRCRKHVVKVRDSLMTPAVRLILRDGLVSGFTAHVTQTHRSAR